MRLAQKTKSFFCYFFVWIVCFISQSAYAEFRSVTAPKTILYEAPSATTKRVYLVSEGYPLEVIVNLGDWLKVRDPYGTLSWVESKNLQSKRTVIVITPDSERTMCTYLGISSHLSDKDINENDITDHALIFLEGYLWDKGISENMFKHAINIAKKNKIKIAMSLSDIFCVTRHKQDFYNLLINDLNILIGNENEIKELTDKKNLLDSINQLKQLNKLIIITRSENGSLAINNNEVTECKSIKINKLLDLTGAGDLFAAGFLKEYLDKSDIKKCLTTGSILASKIIQRIGARLE
jgi:sugar/nucleoside kinase (ribokinase family)